jgi:protein gp37
MGRTKIDWCDYTINPVIGCTFGCEYCYAKKLNDRFHFVEDFSKPQFRKKQLEKINSIKNSIVFMNSMSDISDWTKDILSNVSIALNRSFDNNYLFLTKRPKEMKIVPLVNCWYGITVTNDKDKNKIYELDERLYGYSNKKFISIEPILEKISITKEELKKIDWVIIGAETGNRKSKIIPKKEWIANIVTDCKKMNIPIFMKSSLKDIMSDDFIQEYPQELKRR